MTTPVICENTVQGFAPPTIDKLTAFDRCDACDAAARALWVISTGDLLFCGHHNHKYGPALIAQGASQAVSEPITPCTDKCNCH